MNNDQTMISPAPTGGVSRLLPSVSVYLGGFVIGLTLVSFPASSAILKATHGLTDAQYGSIFIPQLITTIAGALASIACERKLGLKALFITSLIAFAGSHGLLAASNSVPPDFALLIVMASTACFGFGFGFGGGAINAFAALLFPTRSSTSVNAFYMCVGLGLIVAPFYFAMLNEAGLWTLGPLTLLAVMPVLISIAAVSQFPDPFAGETRGDLVEDSPKASLFFWICAGAAVVYAVAEGIFANWAILFLQEERGLVAANAAFALTCFWAALTVGRLTASLLVIKIPPIFFLLSLPFAMIGVFVLLAQVATPNESFLGFALAGLACSAFFPMLVAFTTARYPKFVSWIGAMLTAAFMVGVGLGSYLIGALKGDAPISNLYLYATLYPATAILLVSVVFRIQRRQLVAVRLSRP